jgi:hypothetical protein
MLNVIFSLIAARASLMDAWSFDTSFSMEPRSVNSITSANSLVQSLAFENSTARVLQIAVAPVSVFALILLKA